MKYLLGVVLLVLTQSSIAADYSGYRDTVERVKQNNGIELILFKKMTDENTEHFSIRNLTSDTIKDVKGNLIYRQMTGEVITTQFFSIDATLAPGAAKLTSIPSFDQKQQYSFHLNFDPRGLPPGVKAFMVELADISYQVVSPAE